jgi:hypothetical protein
MEKLTVDRNGKSHHFYSVFACMSEMETVGPEKVLVFGGGDLRLPFNPYYLVAVSL